MVPRFLRPKWLTIGQQFAGMAITWPQLKGQWKGTQVTWTGSIQATEMCSQYIVRIAYNLIYQIVRKM
jgi:hypothetical protein